MWTKLRPFMQVIGNVSDNYERLAKYVSRILPAMHSSVSLCN